jgi:hypothetical protein
VGTCNGNAGRRDREKSERAKNADRGIAGCRQFMETNTAEADKFGNETLKLPPAS